MRSPGSWTLRLAPIARAVVLGILACAVLLGFWLSRLRRLAKHSLSSPSAANAGAGKGNGGNLVPVW